MSLVIGREGPSEVVGAAKRLMLVGWQIAKRLLLLAKLGVPLTHSSLPEAVVTAALEGLRLGGTNNCFLPGRRWMVLLPPIMFLRVASLLWPGAGLLQAMMCVPD